MAKPTSQVMRTYRTSSLESAHDNAELGAALNGFSLSEQGHLAAAIEKTGQAIDTAYMSTTRLVREVFSYYASAVC
jgi:sorting nexin-41/42